MAGAARWHRAMGPQSSPHQSQHQASWRAALGWHCQTGAAAFRGWPGPAPRHAPCGMGQTAQAISHVCTARSMCPMQCTCIGMQKQ